MIKANNRADVRLALTVSRLRVTDDLRFVTDGLWNGLAQPVKQADSVTDDLENRDLWPMKSWQMVYGALLQAIDLHGE